MPVLSPWYVVTEVKVLLLVWPGTQLKKMVVMGEISWRHSNYS